MHVQKLMRPPVQRPLQQLHGHGVQLRAFDHGGPIRCIQTCGPLLLTQRQSNGLTGAADTAGLAGHHFDQDVIGQPLLHVPQQLLGVYQTVNHSDSNNTISNGKRNLPDHIASA